MAAGGEGGGVESDEGDVVGGDGADSGDGEEDTSSFISDFVGISSSFSVGDGADDDGII